MVPPDPHPAGEERAVRGVGVRRAQLPHRRGLRDRHVVEHAEPREHDAGEEQPAQRCPVQLAGEHRQAVALLGRDPREVRGPGRHHAERRRDPEPCHGAQQGRRRAAGEPVREVEHHEHDRRARDEPGEQGVATVEQRGQQERRDDDEGQHEPDERAHPAHPGDGDDDAGEREREDPERQAPREVVPGPDLGFDVRREVAHEHDGRARREVGGPHGGGRPDLDHLARGVARRHLGAQRGARHGLGDGAVGQAVLVLPAAGLARRAEHARRGVLGVDLDDPGLVRLARRPQRDEAHDGRQRDGHEDRGEHGRGAVESGHAPIIAHVAGDGRIVR